MKKSPENSGLFYNGFMKKLLSLVFISVLSFSCSSLEKNSCIENRSALDIGSGATKFKVFAINVCEKKLTQSFLKKKRKSLSKKT